MIDRRLHGLYAITDRRLAQGQALAAQVELALRGGARIIQYRDKTDNHSQRLQEALQLRGLCQEYAALLIINDDVELACESKADGVHLGRHDTDLAEARKLLGGQALIGVSCYDNLDLARRAEAAGADYIAFGRFFPSQSKPEAVQADPALLRQASQQLRLPLVAIGGITPENGASLITAGADMLAVIHGVFGQNDIRQACERFRALFDPEETPT